MKPAQCGRVENRPRGLSICLLLGLTALGACATRASSTGSTNASWGSVAEGIQMSLALAEPERIIGTNDAVKVLVRFRNVTSDARFMFRIDTEFADSPTLRFSVVLPNGKATSPVPHIDVNNPFRGRWLAFVEPGQAKEFTATLSGLCRFDQPGSYSVIATQTVDRLMRGSAQLTAVVVRSQRLTLRIGEGVGPRKALGS